MTSVLLVAYDAECPFCCSVADWAGDRDRHGLIVLFPIQNPELLRMAPELGGLRINEIMHGVDTATRKVFLGGELWLQIVRRLPLWRWLGYVLSVPGLSTIVKGLYKKRNSKRCRARHEWR
jgi:predicted DCC family thiol-disulfide oxidoreductase YuxK